MAVEEQKVCGGGQVQFSAPPAVEPVTLRVATAADAAMLGVVGSATFLEAFTWALPGADIVDFCTKYHTTEQYAKYLAKADTWITLAVTGVDSPVGYVMLCAPELPTFDVLATDIELKRIYLFSRYRGQGTAQRLMDAALDAAREMGRTRVLLGTHADNVRAIAFYLRNGFVEMGSRTFVVGTQVCCDKVYGEVL
jgi:ribosomal protein S18 acetylase RimI-like enzyme